MCDIPVFYATSEGQTRPIAERLAALLRGLGRDSRAIDITAEDAARLDWSRIAGVVVGASVHVGRHQRAVEGFVHRHRERLNARPSAFVSVSLAASSTDAWDAILAHDIARGFVTAAGWHPRAVYCVAGRPTSSRSGLLARWMVRIFAGRQRDRAGSRHGVDLARLDWMERLAKEMATSVAGVQQPAAGATGADPPPFLYNTG